MIIVMDHDVLRACMERHNGSRTAMAAELRCSAATVRRLLRTHELQGDADRLAYKSGRTGSKFHLPAEDAEMERATILQMLIDGVPYKEIAERLGISVPNLYAKRSRLEITADEVEVGRRRAV